MENKEKETLNIKKKQKSMKLYAVLSMKDMTKVAKNAVENSGYSKVKQRQRYRNRGAHWRNHCNTMFSVIKAKYI